MKKDHAMHGVSTAMERKFKDPKGDEVSLQESVDAGIELANRAGHTDEDEDDADAEQDEGGSVGTGSSAQNVIADP